MREEPAIAGCGALLLGLAVAAHSQPQTHEVPTRAFPTVPDEPAPPPSSPAPPPEQRLGAPPPARAHWAPPPHAWPAPGPDAGGAADDKPDRWEDRPTLVEGHFGFGTPYGVFGVAAEHALARYFAPVGGGGYGGSGPRAAGAGVGTILNAGSAECVGRREETDCYGEYQLPFGGLSFGGAF